MSNETTSSGSPWVKESERLPIHYMLYPLKYQGRYYTGYYDYSRKQFFQRVDQPFPETNEVEWLDETLITSLQEENKQLKIDRNNIQDERMKWEARFNEVIKENQHIINHGPHFIDEVGPLIRANRRKEIQISKITELLNDKAKEWYSLKSKE